MVDCPKCGSLMRKQYNDEEIEAIAGNNPMMELEMRRSYVCTKRECSNIHKLSRMDIIKEFVRTRKDKGKSLKEIKDEVKEQREKILDEIETEENDKD